MIKTTAINFLKKLYFAFWWRAQNVKARFIKKKQKNSLAFVFVGRNESWPTLGRELYAKNELFKNTIKECNSILLDFGGEEILSYFEDSVNDSFFANENKFSCITAIQVATIKLYNKEGYYPNAVIGVSLGEPAAAFAAGGLTLNDTLKIALSYGELAKIEKKEYSLLALISSFEYALELCDSCPKWVNVIYENNPETVLIICHNQDLNAIKSFFKLKNKSVRHISDKTYFPYHTPLMQRHNKLHKSFIGEIEALPLKCDYYSPTTGKKIPQNTFLDVDYWCNLIYIPVMFHSAFKAIIYDEYSTYLQIGPPAISDRQFNTNKELKLNTVNSFMIGTDELMHFESTISTLAAGKFEQPMVSASDSDSYKHFVKDFNPYATDSNTPFEYLRKHGPIHFLPQNGSWLILSYDGIEYALKEPKTFSSSIIKEYDPILLGAEPEDHKVVRSLLQPLFSPAVINELADFTTLTAEQILTTLLKQNEFDFVKDYSDPLSLLVLCHFFALSTEDANRMIAFTGKDYHKPVYWQKLEEFFKAEFEVCNLIKEDCLWGKLRSLVSENQFAVTDAVSLLKIVWTAGMATTSALISSSLNYALDEPEITNKIKNDEKLVSKFIEECLRLQPPLGAVYRITTEPVNICNQNLSANSIVLLHLKSGMLDPQQYQNPEKFSISRPAKKHLAFGAGIHQCIGMGIARAEARSALIVVLKSFDQINTYDFSKPEYVISDLKVMSSLKLSKMPNQINS